jgi:hypothetical protein
VQLTLVTGASPSLTSLVAWAEFALCLAVPFFFSGVVVSLALTRSPYPIGKVYGADLIGAASGCIGALVLLNVTSGPSAVLWVGALIGLAALLHLRKRTYFCTAANGSKVPIDRRIFDRGHDDPHDCVEEPARLPNDFEYETVQLENAEIVVRNKTSITSLRPVEAYNLEVVARDIFATPNSLNLQVGRESKSPVSNIHAVTLKLCPQSSPTAAEIHSLPRNASLKSP